MGPSETNSISIGSAVFALLIPITDTLPITNTQIYGPCHTYDMNMPLCMQQHAAEDYDLALLATLNTSSTLYFLPLVPLPKVLISIMRLSVTCYVISQLSLVECRWITMHAYVVYRKISCIVRTHIQGGPITRDIFGSSYCCNRSKII